MSMEPVVLFSIASVLLFGILTILFSVREERIKKKLLNQDYLEKQRLYEISILKTIQDKIGYSLDIDEVLDTLTGSLKSIFPYSVASSLVISGNKLIFKNYIEEPISSEFILQIKKNMLASLQSITQAPLPSLIQEVRLGAAIDDSNTKSIGSFFDIPLIINGKTLALINVSSTRLHLYNQEEIKIFYEIAKQASSALSRLQEVIDTEEAKLLAMIGSLAEGIFMVDKNNSLSIINNNAKKLLGIQSANPTITDISNSFPSNFDISNKIQLVLKEQKVLAEEELSLGKKILKIVMTPVVISPQQKDSNSQPIGVSILLRDITLEKELNKLKEDFTSEVVHELRSPLTAIHTGSELMIEQKEQLDLNQREKLLEIINKQSQRMLTDINSLLDAAKLESGHFAIYQKPESVDALLKDSIALFESEAKKKNLVISADIESDLPKGLFDQIRIGQVINNLISNSLKYTPEGGKIVIKANKYQQGQLPTSLTNPGILISISDNGIGIPQDKQSNLFSKFARLENVGYVHSKEGTGLGLFITKGIVEAHGGKIFLESHPNQGTTVSFTLPIAKDIVTSENSKAQLTISNTVN